MSARDLLLILADSPAAEATSEAELGTVLETLASPLVGVLTRTDQEAYQLTVAPEVMAARLRVLADTLASTPENQGEPTSNE